VPKTSSSVSHQPLLDTTFILGCTRFSRVGRRAPAAGWANCPSGFNYPCVASGAASLSVPFLFYYM
jgi:hypothetical protein